MVMKKRSPKSKKPTARRKAASKSSRKNPSWADVRSAASSAHGAASRTWQRAKPHAKRAAASVKSAAERGYAYAKPRVKSAAASARAAAERGYAYAKPRVKAGTRRALSGLSELSARGAKALENPSRRSEPARWRATATRGGSEVEFFQWFHTDGTPGGKFWLPYMPTQWVYRLQSESDDMGIIRKMTVAARVNGMAGGGPSANRGPISPLDGGRMEHNASDWHAPWSVYDRHGDLVGEVRRVHPFEGKRPSVRASMARARTEEMSAPFPEHLRSAPSPIRRIKVVAMGLPSGATVMHKGRNIVHDPLPDGSPAVRLEDRTIFGLDYDPRTFPTVSVENGQMALAFAINRRDLRADPSGDLVYEFPFDGKPINFARRMLAHRRR